MLKRSNRVLYGWTVLIVLGLMLPACNFAVESSQATATPTATITTTATLIPTVTLTPTITPSPTPTFTPTIASSPTITPTPSLTPTPSATPHPLIGFANDQWQNVEVPAAIQNGLDRPYFAIVSANERTGGTSNPETPVPENEVETLYLVNPSSGEQIELLDLPTSTEGRIFWAPAGDKLVYFMEPTLLPNGARAGGLYLLNLNVGISLRLLDLQTMNPRGIPDHYPVWSPDSSQLAVVLPTAYDVDIFIVSADGSAFQNITAHGAYDFWPAWSPDGRRLAFVSDRNKCPTWEPGEPESCSTLETESAILDGSQPTGGHLFMMDIATGKTQQVSDVWIDSPPVWVSNLQIAYTTGLSDPFAAASEIWITNIQTGAARKISDQEPSLNLGAAWSSGGGQVLYHRASDPASLILKDSNGNLIKSIGDYLFSRFGFSANWSPEGEWIAFGGRNGQCPYGLLVARSNFDIFYAGSSPRACDPSYSPDGLWLAYAGIQTRVGAADGRLDLYIANANGYGARNLTSRFKGEIQLLGWVGPASR